MCLLLDYIDFVQVDVLQLKTLEIALELCLSA